MPAQLFNLHAVLRKGAFGTMIAAVMFAGHGCGSKPAATPPSARPPAAKATGREAEPEAKKSVSSLRSTFVVPPSSKNPFFPSSTRVIDPGTRAPAAVVAGRPAESSGNALALALQGGFQGIVGVGVDRVALINNSTLELDRDTWLSVVLDGREQKIRARATKISRSSITLLVNGQPQPIVLNVFKKK